MNRLPALILAVSLSLVPQTLLAHSFGEPYKLPMPYWMYIYGALAALILSFLVLACFYQSEPQATPWRKVIQLPRWLRHRAVTLALKLSLLMLFVLAVTTGLVGNQDSYRNFNMTFFWIVFALGGCYLSALIGDWYRYLSPWRTLSDGINILAKGFNQGRLRYPRRLAYWPALVLYMTFISLELFGETRPFSLSIILLAYTLINLLAVWLVGAQAWFRYGEFFAVMFRLTAMMSPLTFSRRPEDQSRRIHIVLRAPFSGLIDQRVEHPSLLVFLLFMLSSTAFDGLRETSLWFGLFWKDPLNILTPLIGEPPIYAYVWLRPWYLFYEFITLLLSPLIYLGLFVGFLWLGKLLTRSAIPLGQLAMQFGYSLLPIALVYHITHYYTLLLSQGIKIRALASDPFAWGWNLFGNAITGRIPILPDMGAVWNSQVWLILLGHIASVYLAHVEALRRFPSARQAALSQLPMLMLMVIFTAAGLWILAQPLQG
ncbi:hypothetical protein HCU74_01945 [Spongiibacter sp. KMU-166]|uniref:Fenitrothion hydrolase FedB n=1 Tax=Spongiibacter thalassae TaxID=2721624 RepID=A0ABX1GAI5_9GAMM|nr:hypothetical protein [Spongiibacter thalassae]NKI16172.1 hypothetical protein [Spongiibacter thalassae]